MITIELARRFMTTTLEGAVMTDKARRLIALARTNRAAVESELDMVRRELADPEAIELFDRIIGLMAAFMEE